MPDDYYRILEVDKGATKEEIKKSFRKLSKKYHPDLGGNEEQFKKLNAAYNILSDDNKRREYDNPLDDVFRGFSNFFRGGFPFGSNNKFNNVPIKGRNVQYTLVISLYESICGCNKKIKYNFKDVCDKCNGVGGTDKVECKICNGSGVIVNVSESNGVKMVNKTICRACGGSGFVVSNVCEKCNGNGVIKKDGEIDIELHPDTPDGLSLRSVGRGSMGINGGPSGDLIVNIRVKMPKKTDFTDDQLEILKNVFGGSEDE